MMEKIAAATSLCRCRSSAEYSGAHKQQTDGPDRVLVNHIGLHDEAHNVANLFRLTNNRQMWWTRHAIMRWL